ncbi:MAG: SpoIIIAH-like family protein [Oscillospiraceae bacterium]|nr:SpoIIIAH-like family protein [Oscillospiraceae bacterium]
MKIWQRNAVVAVVVLFVAISVYLSWSYNQELDINADVPVHAPLGGDESTPAGIGETLSTERQAYFAEARLTRQRARDSALAMLNEVNATPASTQEVRDKASEDIRVIAEYAMLEATIEGLIRAQGFADSVAYISESRLTIVVAAPEGGLTAVDVARIKNIALNETSYTIEQISIMEA